MKPFKRVSARDCLLTGTERGSLAWLAAKQALRSVAVRAMLHMAKYTWPLRRLYAPQATTKW